MCLLSETVSSRIFVLEEPVRGQRVVVRRESVVAFVGAAPRGPVGIPVAIRSIDEYRRRFGSPGHRSRVQDHLTQFFENGGTSAIFVRVSGSERRHRIFIPALGGDLVLDAINPGPLECVRASIDYDGIADDDGERFNLVIHRLTSRDHPIVEDQELYGGLSVDPDDPDYVLHVLANSNLVSVFGPVPTVRPEITLSPGIEVGASYLYADESWHESPVLTDYDLIGSNTDGTGIFALDRLPILDLICLVPTDGEVGPVALFAADRYCHRRQAMLFVDPPLAWSNVAAVMRDRHSAGLYSPNVMTYYPRPAPPTGVGADEAASALGAILGRLVAGDAEEGVWGALDRGPIVARFRDRLTCHLDDHDSAALLRVGVNPLRECAGGYVQLEGLVTLGRCGGYDAQAANIAPRRLSLFIIGSIVRSTRWAAFEKNGPAAWSEVAQQVAEFLRELHDAGALDSSGTRNAHYVICDRETNSGGHRDVVGHGHGSGEGEPGGVNFIVGFALRGQEFQTFRFAHDQLECHVHSGGWQPRVALAS